MCCLVSMCVIQRVRLLGVQRGRRDHGTRQTRLISLITCESREGLPSSLFLIEGLRRGMTPTIPTRSHLVEGESEPTMAVSDAAVTLVSIASTREWDMPIHYNGTSSLHLPPIISQW